MNGHSANSSTSVSSPILVKQSSRLIDGIRTDVLVQSFADRILILVTQLGKVGTLTQISMPMTSIDEPYELSPAVPSLNLPSLPVPHTSLQISPLLSTPPSDSKIIYEVYLNQIGMLVLTGFGPRPNPPLPPSQAFGRGSRQLVVGLALDFASKASKAGEGDSDKERIKFGSIMEMVMECRIW
ncbi:hypothetical protein CROQUDRAFT_656350 [Cronartium quercuum f. sp. fusiforme G11]|uniref:Proteasome assembly chaperone 3 n=1 Tax=Cronartium quercuum f. sp. fusiforme G11 TaxID=708437 RepID=A0A9P6NPH8_9BASI|nr:hypothetical protein CROQUDRAFT_656350 [Cronartium quercuum f. sp. fusiforme G11]